MSLILAEIVIAACSATGLPTASSLTPAALKSKVVPLDLMESASELGMKSLSPEEVM